MIHGLGFFPELGLTKRDVHISVAYAYDLLTSRTACFVHSVLSRRITFGEGIMAAESSYGTKYDKHSNTERNNWIIRISERSTAGTYSEWGSRCGGLVFAPLVAEIIPNTHR